MFEQPTTDEMTGLVTGPSFRHLLCEALDDLLKKYNDMLEAAPKPAKS